MPDRAQIVRDAYTAYETGDRELLEGVLADEIAFFAPPDPGLDREAYFERCWPNHETIEKFEVVRLTDIGGDEFLITYESLKTDGRRFRNTEILGFDPDDKICRQEVYFGWDL
ncbi:MAG TPA: hypothetical protein VIT85_02025 [Solirubrobacterales bacterium]